MAESNLMDLETGFDYQCPKWLTKKSPKPRQNKRYLKKTSYILKQQQKEAERQEAEKQEAGQEETGQPKVEQQEAEQPEAEQQESDQQESDQQDTEQLKVQQEDQKKVDQEDVLTKFLENLSLERRASVAKVVPSWRHRFDAAKRTVGENIIFKVPFNVKETEEEADDTLSRNLVRLLRDWLPKSGKSYDKNDGSLLLADAAKLLRCSTEEIHKALVLTKGQKIRMMAYRKYSKYHSEDRILVLSGHFFPVKNPLGAFGVGIEAALQMRVLVHETSALADIKKSDFLSCMNRLGGVNLTVGRSMGYRKSARYEIEIDVASAVSAGVFFIENRISGLVFGLGHWDKAQNWYNGKIPFSQFCTAKFRK